MTQEALTDTGPGSLLEEQGGKMPGGKIKKNEKLSAVLHFFGYIATIGYAFSTSYSIAGFIWDSFPVTTATKAWVFTQMPATWLINYLIGYGDTNKSFDDAFAYGSFLKGFRLDDDGVERTDLKWMKTKLALAFLFSATYGIIILSVTWQGLVYYSVYAGWSAATTEAMIWILGTTGALVASLFTFADTVRFLNRENLWGDFKSSLRDLIKPPGYKNHSYLRRAIYYSIQCLFFYSAFAGLAYFALEGQSTLTAFATYYSINPGFLPLATWSSIINWMSYVGNVAFTVKNNQLAGTNLDAALHPKEKETYGQMFVRHFKSMKSTLFVLRVAQLFNASGNSVVTAKSGPGFDRVSTGFWVSFASPETGIDGAVKALHRFAVRIGLISREAHAADDTILNNDSPRVIDHGLQQNEVTHRRVGNGDQANEDGGAQTPGGFLNQPPPVQAPVEQQPREPGFCNIL